MAITKAEELFSQRPRSVFFVALEAAVQDACRITCQVPLYSLVKVANHAPPGAWSRIARKSVDFVLADTVSWDVLLVIELDDPSHERADRIKRDDLINSVLVNAGISILRVKARRHYDVDALRSTIREFIWKGTGSAGERLYSVPQTKRDDAYSSQTAASIAASNDLSVFRKVMIGLLILFTLGLIIAGAGAPIGARTYTTQKRATESNIGNRQATNIDDGSRRVDTREDREVFACSYSDARTDCEKVKVPEESIFLGDRWICKYGYKQVGDTCEEVFVPPNARYVHTSQSWRCLPGYEKNGETCVSYEP